MSEKPYHKYVFNQERRAFVGDFEKMYQNEDKEGYDSWNQEDNTHLTKQISLSILSKYNFTSILDIGCGKGAFTQLLKKGNNRIVGIDISKTAIDKAKSKYKDIDFISIGAQEYLDVSDKFDLIVTIEILSYIKDWEDLIIKISKKCKYFYLSLYLPPNPIGFVKSFDSLRKVFLDNFTIEEEKFCNNEVIFILGKSRYAS